MLCLDRLSITIFQSTEAANPIFHRSERIAEYGIVGFAANITIPYPLTPSSPSDDGILCLPYFIFLTKAIVIGCKARFAPYKNVTKAAAR